MKRLRKILFWVLVVLVVAIAGALTALPDFLENYVEEHDIELLGREVSIGDIEMNYFTTTLNIQDFVLFENESETDFVAFKSLEVNLNPWAAFKNTIHVESITLSSLYAQVLQDGNSFNFDDLLALGGDSTEVAELEVESEPWHILVQNVLLHGGSVAYQSDINPRFQIDSLRIDVPLYNDTVPVIKADVSLGLSTGGHMVIKNTINTALTTYNVLLESDDISVSIVKPYMEQVLEIDRFEGLLSANFGISGNWTDSEVFNLGGDIALRDFAMSDLRGEEVASLGLFDLDIDTIRMGEGVYNIHHVKLDRLYGLYEMDGEGDNFSKMMVDGGSAKSDSTSVVAVDVESVEENSDGTEVALIVEVDEPTEEELDYANPFAVLAFYIKDIAKSYKESTYNIGEISVRNSSFDYNDYTPADPFKYHFDDLTLLADSLESDKEDLTFNANAVLNQTGTFEARLRTFTANLEDIDLYYKISGVELTPFSPYTSEYVDYPIVLGDLLCINDTKIRDGILVSENIFDCNQFNFGDRVDGKAHFDLPVKLAVGILKDLDGNIHLDVPVEGDLNDPKFKLIKVILQVLKNIIVKAVTAPFRLLATQFGVDEESLKQINFNLLSLNLSDSQQKQLDNLAKVVEKKEGLNIEFKRVTKKYEEVERYATNEAKYRYLYKSNDVPEIEDVPQEVLDRLNHLDINDSLFVQFVNSKVDELDRDLPIHKKCLVYIGEEHAISKTDRVGQIRADAIENYLVSEKLVSPERVRFRIMHEDSLITNRNNSIYNVGFWVNE